MSKLRYLAVVVGVLALGASVLGAQTGRANAATTSYTFYPINYPESNFTQTLGINNSNIIAGYHGDGVHNPNQGWKFVLPNHFIFENYPQSAQTQVIGINNANNTDGFYIDTAGVTHGFLLLGGTYVTADFPGTTFNQLLGLNDSGVAAGYYQDAAGVFHPYLRLPNGTFRELTLQGLTNAQATGINDNEQVVGFAMTSPTTSFGFRLTGTTLVTLRYPGSTFTQALGINRSGEVVGSYNDSAGVTHGFLWNNGVFQSIDYPGASSTVVNGINDNGRIVGFFVNPATGNTLGFLGLPQ
jgi:probable HAF family extracellular repeat protein